MPPHVMDTHSSCCDGDSPSLPSSLSSSLPLHPPSSGRHSLTKSTSNIETKNDLLQLAAMELESMRSPPPCSPQSNSPKSSPSSSTSLPTTEVERSFPPACMQLLSTLPGNIRCHDCQTPTDATWASVSYGITLCLQCSGKHRGLGVNVSFIKSLTLDSWKRREILAMLEGGNEQLTLFFDRHDMGSGGGGGGNNNIDNKGSGGGKKGDDNNNNTNNVGTIDRYKTKAASFYRQHLMSHAKQVSEGGLYEGREASRRNKGSKTKKVRSDEKLKRKKSRDGTHLPTVEEKEVL